MRPSICGRAAVLPWLYAVGLLVSFQVGNPPPESTTVRGPLPGQKYILTSFEFWLSLEVLLFGLLVVFAEFLLLRARNVRPEETLRVYAVTLIIVGTLFAITAGFDNNQVAPAIGLFGTIAGYLLGRRTPSERVEPKKEE
jgi:hypothetical protein